VGNSSIDPSTTLAQELYEPYTTTSTNPMFSCCKIRTEIASISAIEHITAKNDL
jgi:hypothetical protein